VNKEQIKLGWREWVVLPELNLPPLKAKIDTAARTSCLHAFSIEPFTKNQADWVRFGMHPHQKNSVTEVLCEAKVIDKRVVTDSGGHKEERYVISTLLELGAVRWPIEITLTNRDTMRFRMLLGRTAMKKKIIVNPSVSYLLGRPAEGIYTEFAQENVN
jgi:hypothetical protein